MASWRGISLSKRFCVLWLFFCLFVNILFMFVCAWSQLQHEGYLIAACEFLVVACGI